MINKSNTFFSLTICKFSKRKYLCTSIAKIAHLVEHDLAPKGWKNNRPWQEVIVKTFTKPKHIAKIAQFVEHDLAPKGWKNNRPWQDFELCEFKLIPKTNCEYSSVGRARPCPKRMEK